MLAATSVASVSAWVQALGVCRVENKKPMTTETIFHAASLSKQVTAHSAFALRGPGKVGASGVEALLGISKLGL